jgi:hypothetical protein
VRKRLGKDADHAPGLAEQPGQFGKHRAVSVGAIAHLIALRLAQQQAGLCQAGEFLVQRAGRGARESRQFAHVVTAVGMQQQLGQGALAVAAEEKVE